MVDPHLKILSTANVPCQQRDWWRDHWHIAQLGTRLDRLPVESWDTVFDRVKDDFPFSLDEAKEMRLDLMDERKSFANIDHQTQFENIWLQSCSATEVISIFAINKKSGVVPTMNSFRVVHDAFI